MKKRLDQHLVDIGLAPSKTKAQELIEAGQVFVSGARIKKSAYSVPVQNQYIKLASTNILKYVSRAGFKLEEALNHFNIAVRGLCALDVGQSTGGFTDCLLQRGIKKVVGVDVADDQLDLSLRDHKRVKALFGINAKILSKFKKQIGGPFDLIVVDLSFISLQKVLAEVTVYLKPGGHLLALIKPQFEVGSVNLNKKGIVKSQGSAQNAIEDNKLCAQHLGLLVAGVLPVKTKGRDGNQEYFLYANKQ